MREAVILATEESPALGALLNRQPAALLPIGGRPLLDHVITTLVRADIRQITICLGRRGSAVMAYAGDGGRWGVDISYVSVPPDLGSGGALRWAAPCLHGPTLVLHADRLLLFGPQLLAALPTNDAPATRLSFADHSGSAHAGGYLLTPELLTELPSGRWELDRHLEQLLHERGQELRQIQAVGYLNLLRTAAEYHLAQRDLLDYGQADRPSAHLPPLLLPGRMVATGITIGRGTYVHAEARLTPPLLIGADCWIGADTEIGPYASIGDQCVIDAGATVRESSVMSRSYVGRLAHLHGRIVDQQQLIDPRQGLIVQVDDPLLLAATQQGSSQVRLLGERALALLLLLAVAPLLLLFALLILISVRRWPFRYGSYVGVRPGQPARREPEQLRLLEFRLLGRSQTPSPVGRLIWSLDLHYLPRLWSVLSGELALVGVRPLAHSEAALLNEPWHQTRYSRPTGFTGLWYVQPQHTYDLEAIAAADVYYAVAADWRDQVLILLRTIPAWFRRRHQIEGREPLIALSERLV